MLADPGLHKRPRDLDLPPWQKGRYGSAVGRAVHGVLQTDRPRARPTPTAVAAAVASQAAAEGLLGHEAHIHRLVDAALASPTVREAGASRHWREVYVGVPLGGDRTLEGYVDLLYRRADGLVVADYKTGPTGPDDDLDPLVARYRAQGAAYALAVAARHRRTGGRGRVRVPDAGRSRSTAARPTSTSPSPRSGRWPRRATTSW